MATGPFPSETLISMNEGIYLYEMELESLDQYRILALDRHNQLLREEIPDVEASQHLIAHIDELIARTLEARNNYNALNERRNRLLIELHESTYELLEERTRPQPDINPESTENVMQQLFSPNINDRTRVTVKHLVFYCLHKNNYILGNPYQSIYVLLKDFWNPTKGIGEAVLIMGYKYRDKFRTYIDENYPRRRFLSLSFIEFVTAALTHMFCKYYMPGNTHLTFLIVVSFAMEIVYYLREYPYLYRRQIIKFTVYKLSCLLSGPEFINTCGMDRLEMYGVVVYKGHMLAPPFDYLRSPLYQSRRPAYIPWDYLERYPQTDFDEPPELPTSTSMQLLEALPVGTEAGNIVSGLRISQYRFEKSKYGASTSNSGTSTSKSGTSISKSESSISKSGTSMSKPGTSAQKPGTSAHKPGTSAHKPGTSAHKPGTSAHKPGTSAHKPGTSAHKPGTSAHKPGASAQKPGASAQGSGTSAQGSGTSAQGSGTSAQGSGTSAQGSGTSAQGSGTSAQGSGTSAQGSGTSAQGSGTSAQGSGTSAQGSGTSTEEAETAL